MPIKSDKHLRWIIYLISCLLFILSQFYRSSTAVISPDLVEDLNLDANDLGLVSAAFFYAFAAMQVPVGFFLDSVGPRLLMTALSLVSVAGAVVFAYGESTAGLVAGRLLLGIGMSCNLMGPLKLMTNWFSPRYFATLSTLFLSIGTAGNIAAATPLVWLANRLGWRWTFLLFAALNLAITICFFAVVRNRPLEAPADAPVKTEPVRFSEVLGGVMRLFAHKNYWLISMGTFFRYGIYASVQALWAGPFLMITMKLSPVMAGNLLLVVSIGLIVGGPICGWISDTVLMSRKRVVIPGLAVMAGALLALARLPGDPSIALLFVLFFVFGFSSSAGQIMYAHIKERMPLENAGAAMTGINFFTMVGVAFFLHGLGWAIKTFYPLGSFAPEAFRMAFIIFGGCLALAGLLYAMTTDSLKGRKAR